MKRRVLRRAIVAVTSILAVGFLPVAIYWGTDLAIRAHLRALGRVTLESASEFERVGFQKPVIKDDMVDGNAWDMYSKALWYNLQRSGKPDRDDSVHKYVRLGVQRRECTLPVRRFEEEMYTAPRGIEAVSEVAERFAAKSKQLRGDDDWALVRDAIDVVVFAQDIAGGNFGSRGQQLAHGIVHPVSWREIQAILSRAKLDGARLKEFAVTVNALANAWPDVSKQLEADRQIMAYNLAGFDLRRAWLYYAGPTLLGDSPWPSPRSFHIRSRSWRYVFFPRSAYSDYVHFLGDILPELSKAESEGWPALSLALGSWRSKERVLSDYIVGMRLEECSHRYAVRFRIVTNLRILGTSALIRAHLSETGRWPDGLSAIEPHGMRDLLVDPMSGEALRYSVYPGGDSAVVYSVGPNMVDDGGERDIPDRKDDMFLVVRRPGTKR